MKKIIIIVSLILSSPAYSWWSVIVSDNFTKTTCEYSEDLTPELSLQFALDKNFGGYSNCKKFKQVDETEIVICLTPIETSWLYTKSLAICNSYTIIKYISLFRNYVECINNKCNFKEKQKI